MICPVSPADELLCLPCEDDAGYAHVGDAEAQYQPGEEQLVESDVLDAEEDVVVQPAECLPVPKSPSAREIAVHNLTHLPYRSWCRHCVAARRPNSQHRTLSSQRSTPLLVADYCFLEDQEDAQKATVLVACLYPSRSMLATSVPAKGPDPVAVARLATFIKVPRWSTRVTRRLPSDRSLKLHFKPLAAKVDCTIPPYLKWCRKHPPPASPIEPPGVPILVQVVVHVGPTMAVDERACESNHQVSRGQP